MSYKTILVYLDASPRCAPRATLAAQWARAHGAHLVGLVPTGLYDGIIPSDGIVAGGADFIAQSAQYLRERAEAISAAFREHIGDGAGMPSHEVRVVDSTAIDAVLRHGRTSDLVVLGQHDVEANFEMVPADLPQRALMELGRPVLMVPYAGRFEGPARQAVVAWDGSREAALALRDALPALSRAAKVTLISFRRPGRDADDDDLLAQEMLHYLHSHGVEAGTERGVSDIDVADSLLSHISDLGADLLVMGGYGHSRFRELMLGGATRQVLAQMTVPVLMSH